MSSNLKPFMNKNETSNADCLQRSVRRAGEREIKLAAQLYAARDAARGLWRHEYQDKISGYQLYIRKGMEKYKLDEIQTTMKLVKLVTDESRDSGMQVMMLLAAYVEMIEPSTPNDGR